MAPRHVLLAAPVVLALGLAGTPATAQQPDPAAPARAVQRAFDPSPLDLPEGSVIADGRIYELLRDGDRLYATGGFRTIGRYDGPGDVLDGETGSALPSPEIADGQISVVVGDGAGGWYLGGDFSEIGGQPAGGLAHVLPDGTLDRDFLPVADGLVSALALAGDTLYVGGIFSTVDGTDRKHLAAVSTEDGSVLPFAAPQSKRVTELVLDPGTAGRSARLFVGTDHVVAVDPVTGAALAGFSSPVDGDVRAMTLGGDRLYVGTDELVALDASTGAVDAGFDPGDLTGDGRAFHSLLWTGSVLYAGSDYADRLVALDPATGDADPGFAPELAGENGTFGGPGGVYDLALDGDRLWVAGSFTSAGGQGAHGLAVLDAATGDREDNGLPSYNQQVNAVELGDGHVYVGGTFYMTDWVRTRGVAALDADTLQPAPGFRVRPWTYGELVVGPDVLYLAPNHFQGYDSRAGSTEYYYDYTSRVRALDPETGAVLDDRSLEVRNLSGVTTIGDRLYVARRLESDVKFPRNRIDVYDATGHKVRSFPVPLRGYVTTLTTIGGDLVAGGSFKRTAPNGGPRNTAMIRIDPRTGERNPSFDPRIHGPVYDVAPQGTSLFASGLFHRVNQLADGDRPGLVKLSARSRQDAAFVPKAFDGDRPLVRLHPLGGLLWVDAARQIFLDTETGAKVPSPLDWDGWLDAVATTPAGYAYAAGMYPNLGGDDALDLGYIAVRPVNDPPTRSR